MVKDLAGLIDVYDQVTGRTATDLTADVWSELADAPSSVVSA
jgi:hypothetical protein